MNVVLNAALVVDLVRLRGRQYHMPQRAILIDHLLHEVARWHLDRHRNWWRTALGHHWHSYWSWNERYGMQFN